MIEIYIKVGGVKGVGKTRIVKGVIEKFANEGIEIKHIRPQDIMISYLGCQKPEDMSNFSLQKRIEARNHSYKVISDSHKNDNIIVDAHFVIKSGANYESTFTDSYLCAKNILNMNALAVVTADPNEILKRRTRDIKNKIRELNIDNIIIEQTKEVEESRKISSMFGKPLHEIENEELQSALENFTFIVGKYVKE